ncbi:MAG: DUF4198 domain-containing protein [Gammaproteobacteria bacterium]|nr:DUF4198 domain-containing protein [Gammaproteobacteria bacterium]MBU1646435.1 DUF4198 domain-containing protein [Gammaproteobacteria bacterium]MBU1970978.1 DUF4198 domain-containing protein [Gammaproteobacteria bacterium]
MNHLAILAAAGLATAGAPAMAQQHEHHAPAATQPAAPAAAPQGQRPGGSREWTRAPLLLPAMARGGERGGATLRPMGIEAANVTVYAGDGPAERRRVDYPVGPEGAKLKSAAPKVGNYHWVVARQESDGEVKVASTAWYFSNPGDAPTDLLKQSRHELEIVPDPLPREHGNYRESDKWRFIVRYAGQPLANQTLTMETEYGSRSRFVTDAAGVATVLFPRDFKPAEEGHDAHGRRKAKFVLTTEKEDAGKRYLTAFNYTYTLDADRDRSLGWGAAFGLLGMIAATPLLRRRSTRPTAAGQGDSNA